MISYRRDYNPNYFAAPAAWTRRLIKTKSPRRLKWTLIERLMYSMVRKDERPSESWMRGPNTICLLNPCFADMSHSTAEVLDLTHDHALPFRLQFDDHSWRQHLNSLKPLGLAILLNTCNMNTQEHYMQFCCHVTCEALYNENLVPVTNRRYAHLRSFFFSLS